MSKPKKAVKAEVGSVRLSGEDESTGERPAGLSADAEQPGSSYTMDANVFREILEANAQQMQSNAQTQMQLMREMLEKFLNRPNTARTAAAEG